MLPSGQTGLPLIVVNARSETGIIAAPTIAKREIRRRMAQGSRARAASARTAVEKSPGESGLAGESV